MATKSATRNGSAKQSLDVATVCRCIVEHATEKPDGELLKATFGDASFRTLPEIAEAFGVSSRTVNQGWRQNGLPGTTGNYLACEVVAWLLERKFRNSEQQRESVVPANERLRSIEIRRAELALAKDERRERELSGRSIDLFQARAELSAALSITRESLSSLPRILHPQLPGEHSDEITAAMESEVRKTLVHLAENLRRLMHKQTSEEYDHVLRRLEEIEHESATGTV